MSIPLSTSYDGGADSDGIRNIPNSVSFNATGETSKTFTVTAWDDFIDNDGRTATISFGTPPSRVTEGSIPETVVSVTDDDTRGFTITPASGPVSVGENATTTYTILMKSEPSDDVTVTVNNPTDSDDATAAPATLTFDAQQFADGALTVTVTTTDDEVDEPTETATVTHTVSGGDYGDNNVTIPDFVITITDDDETPVVSGSATQSFPETEYDDDSPDLEVATYSATRRRRRRHQLVAERDGLGLLRVRGGLRRGPRPVLRRNRRSPGRGRTSRTRKTPNPSNTYQVTVEASDGTNTGNARRHRHRHPRQRDAACHGPLSRPGFSLAGMHFAESSDST